MMTESMSNQRHLKLRGAPKVRICWFDDIFNLLGHLPYPLAALSIGLACLAVATVPLVVSRQAHLAMELPFVLGFVGLVLCTAFARWTTLRYRATIDPLIQIVEPAFHAAFMSTTRASIARLRLRVRNALGVTGWVATGQTMSSGYRTT